MNAKLLEVKSRLDDNAQISEEAILKVKKEMYSKQIATVGKAELESKRDLGIKPVNANWLNSSYLNDNPHFKEIKAAFAAYNALVGSLPTDPIVLSTYHVDQLHIRPVLIDSLLKFMRLVMLTPEREVQGRMLAEVHAWYKEQTTKREYKTKLQRLFEEELEKRLQDIRKASKPAECNLPYEQIRLQKAAYLRHNRTAHTEIHSPAHQLKEYKRRILNFDETVNQLPTVAPPAHSRIKYQKPQPFSFRREPESLGEPISKEHNITSVTTNPNLSTDITDATAQQIPLPDGTLPADQPPVEDQNNIVLEDFGLGEEQQEGEPEPQVEEDGKLDPRIKNYIYPASNYQEAAETRMHERMIKLQHKVEQTSRQDEAKYESLKEWSRHRCRLQSELSRKIEATKEYAVIGANKIYRAKTEAAEKFINLSTQEQGNGTKISYEGSIHAQRLQEVKRFGLRSINFQKSDPVHKLQSMSVFDRKRQVKQNRSLSEVLQDHSRGKQREQSLQQIQQIKQRFAKYKIPVELRRVGEGLMPPTQLQPMRLEAFGPVDVHLPSNPFMKVAKKKKKKKK